MDLTKSRRELTIGDVIRTVLPMGSIGIFYSYDAEENNSKDNALSQKVKQSWSAPPIIPLDLFAVCAQLVQVSGLMGYFEPDPNAPSEFDKNQSLSVVLTNDERSASIDAGKQWQRGNDGKPPNFVVEHWKQLLKFWNFPVRATAYQKFHKAKGATAPSPLWWRSVYLLLIAADEASENIGHVYLEEGLEHSFIESFIATRLRNARSKDEPIDGDENFRKMGSVEATYAAAADPGVICVQPKARISRVGCSLRNISRNLSTTVPSGTVRCHWQQLDGHPKAEENDGLDVLLIPLPYELSAKQFKSSGNETQLDCSTRHYPGWGNFELDSTWLNDLRAENGILDHVRKLIRKAKEDVETVNAIIFPELALSYETFKEICAEVVKEEPEIEFMIAGANSNCEEDECNCVITAIWEKTITEETADARNVASRITSQKKHHRWRLERSQLSDYALAARLHPDKDWWEKHKIGQRELNFFQFRKNSVFASLICEDLARNDPVHEVVRSVAPNILFALLMDGPQISQRWPSRYASTLADDPGTSVLTFTSYGLIRRMNENSKYPHSDSVALWKDEAGGFVEIKLPADAKGVLLSLSAVSTTDVTIDGREVTNAKSWRFNSQKPLKI